MKRLIALLMAVAMLLTVTACGNAAPAETAPEATVAAPQVPEAAIEVPAPEPTEDPYAYSVYTLGESENYQDVIWDHGFWEVDLNECVKDAQANGATGAYANPISLELSKKGFRMELDYSGYMFMYGKVVHAGTVTMVGAKADGLADISGIDSQKYSDYGDSAYASETGVTTEYFSTFNGQLLMDEYSYFNLDENGMLKDLTVVEAFYYPANGNLYNVIYDRGSVYDEYVSPDLLVQMTEWTPGPPFRPTVQTLTYGDFTFEMSQFAIQCGSERKIYNYRPGMSFSDWACSELNTDGWIPWYGDTVLSPDRAYIVDWGYLDMRDMMNNSDQPGNVIFAEEYDGSINYLNNRYTAADSSSSSFDAGSIPGLSGGNVMTFDVTGMSQAEIDALLAQYDTSSPVATITPPEGSMSSTDDLLGMIATEEREIAEHGNISVPVAHMVNAETPLFTPGFRIVSKENGRSAYHSVEMTTQLLLDDVLDIYMNGIADELIPHIKLYAFPESEAFMKTLEGHTILDVHPTAYPRDHEMLQIPENAVCLSFERVPDGEEAPGSLNPRKPAHENLNKDAVYARYVTKDDPNFGEGVNLVFAITFDDELVYWIHMGSDFHETCSIEYVSGGMRY